MAVIYLPEDKRVGDIGDALGGLVGTYFKKKHEENTQIGVADLIKKAGSPEEAFTAVQSQYGKEGLSVLKNLYDSKAPLLKAQETQANIAKSGAETTRAQAGANKDNVEALNLQQNAPLIQMKLQSEVQKNKAEALQAQTDIAGAGSVQEKAKAEASLAKAKARETELQSDLAQHMADLARNGQNPLSVAGISDELYKSLPTLTQQSILAKASSGKPQEAIGEFSTYANSQVKTAATQAIKEAQVKPLDTPTMTKLESSASLAADTEQLLDNIGDAGTGGFKSRLNAALVNTGQKTSTPEFQNALAAEHQMVISGAEGVSGNKGQPIINLIKQTTPDITQAPTFAITATKLIAKQALAKLTLDKQNYESSNTTTKPIDTQIDKWKAVYDKADSLKYDVQMDSSGNKHANTYYNGAMVDQQTLKALPGMEKTLPLDQIYKLGDNTITGATLNDAAFKVGKTPQEILELYKAHIGGK